MKSDAKVSAARAAAYDILLRVEREDSYAGELLHSSRYERLSSLDHALATELVMGVLRWRSLLDSEIASSSAQPISKLDREVLMALRLGVYQLRNLDRIPARAAISESVELIKRARKRSAAGFVNAILRKIAQQEAQSKTHVPDIRTGNAMSIAESSAHPLWLVERWIHSYGHEAGLGICQYDQTRPVTAIRLRLPDADNRLSAEGIVLSPGKLLSSSRRVERGNVSKSAAFETGAIVIQDEASQLIAALMGHAGTILDCCAAPGGKTLAIADRNPGAQISAVELHPHRSRLLRERLNDHRPDSSLEIRVVTGDIREWALKAKFERVLADVPCSGTGTLARNPEIKWKLKPEDLTDLQQRQVDILRSAMAHVADGGRVIYSTCSLEDEENEKVIERAMSEAGSFHLIDCGEELVRLRGSGELIWPNPSSLTRGGYLRTIPGVHPCDGFFAAILQKSD